MHDADPVANLHRMHALASHDLFDPELADELRTICARTARRLDIAVAAVQVVLDSATAVLATNGGETDFLTPVGGAPNELSLCVNVVTTRAPYVIDDLSTHAVHAQHPGVTAGLIGAYAGIPLTLPTGEIVGSHCVMHPKPRHFTDRDLAELAAAAAEVTDRITRRPLISRY